MPLRAPTLQEAALSLVETLTVPAIASQPDKLRRQFADKLPPEFVTVVGQAFLLHCRTDAVRRLAVAMGIAPETVYREPDSTKGARLVVLIVAPPKDAAAYLQAVSAFARFLGRADVVDGLLTASSADDVLRASPFAEARMPGELMVRDFMIPKVFSVRADATLEEAARFIVDHNVPSLPVVSENTEVLGMVSHRELLRVLLPKYVKRVSSGEFPAPVARGREREDPNQLPVREVMDRSVLCISEDQTLADVAGLMVTKDIDRFPVVREGVLVGFITRGDIVRRIFGP